MKNKAIVLSSIFAVLIIIIILIFMVNPNEEVKIVKIGYLPIISSLNLYIAQDQGFFEEEGITIETVQLQSSNQLIDALVRGDIDVAAASSSVPAMVADIIDPGKIKIFSVSDITEDHPSDAILVKEESLINSLEDLEGKKIGVFPGSTSSGLLRDFLSKKGIDVSNIEYVSLSPPNQLPALYGGSIDALQAYEPEITLAVQQGEVKKIYGSVYAEQLNHNPLTASLISSEFINENPELARKTVSVFDKAVTFMKTNDRESREIVVRKIGVNESIANEVIFRYMSKSDEVNNEALQSFADLLFEIGELESEIDVTKLLYSS